MVTSSLEKSAALSMRHTHKNSIVSRKIAFLVADGVDEKQILQMKKPLEAAGAVVELIAPKLCAVIAEGNTEIPIMKSFLTTASVLYDAIYVPGGTISVAALAAEPDAIQFLNEAFKHCKPIGAAKDAVELLNETNFSRKLPTTFTEAEVMLSGIIIGDGDADMAGIFIKAIAQHRFWDREKPHKIPA